jgi:putative ABC transport system permease protein
VSGDWWSTQINEVIIQVKQGANIERVGKNLSGFFAQKYGPSGSFRVDSDSLLLAQMKQFLGLFTVLLAAIALVTLSVGGMGITNMMLVSVAERYREIGIRKAVGATASEIKIQFLVESVLTCAMAGVLGLVLGFVAYQSAIAFASRIIGTIPFEWVLDGGALLVALVSILLVGILSGLFPAFKAEKLKVIEALRSE